MLEMPSSVANLYSYGIIDHVPYEVYDNTPPSHSSNYPSKSEYLSKDEFKHSNNEENYNDLINKEKESVPKPVLKTSSIWKGLIAAAFIIATPILIFKGVKSGYPKFKQAMNNFWTKINPKNWFKKK